MVRGINVLGARGVSGLTVAKDMLVTRNINRLLGQLLVRRRLRLRDKRDDRPSPELMAVNAIGVTGR
jgi:hypothetical protein